MRLIFTITLLLLSFSAMASQSCQPNKYTYKQCEFVSPELRSGETKIVAMKNSSTEGVVDVGCKSGVVSYENAICRAANDGCLIPANQWISKAGNACKHLAIPEIMSNGAEKSILSVSNDGIVKYKCDGGQLDISTIICNDFKSNQIQAIEAVQQNEMQILSDIVINYEGCDIGIVDVTIETFNVHDINDHTCSLVGFTNLIEIASADASGYLPNSQIEPYSATLRCSGNTNPATMCESVVGESDSEIIVLPQNCDDARVSGQVYNLNRLEASDIIIERDLCLASGYPDLVNIVSTIESHTENGDDIYNAIANCSGNTNPSTRCSATSISGGSNVVSQSCGEAVVNGFIPNLTISTEQEPPENSAVQAALCTANGFNNLNSITNYEFEPTGRNGVWNITAVCDTNNTSNCNDPCLGDVWTSQSTRSQIITPEGVFENMCIDINPPPQLCNDCENAAVIFTDSNSGNTCRVSNINLLTGEDDTVVFDEAGFTGFADLNCNSGLVTASGGECYQNCQGGELARWADGRGALNCQAAIPSGEYTHEQQVSLTTTTNNGNATFICNNGGWEEVGLGQCILNCNGNVRWGNGLSRSGVNKTNLCSADIGTLIHASGVSSIISETSFTTGSAIVSCNDGNLSVGSQTCLIGCGSETGVWGSGRCASALSPRTHNGLQSVSTPISLTGNSGTASFTCDDGLHDINANTCLPDCPSGNFNVGACTVPMQAGKALSIQSYSVSTTNREGAGDFRCDSATWQPNSGTCVAGIVVRGPWSVWQNDGGIYGCSEWLPRTNTVPSGQQFQQNSNCNLNQSRSADRYREFNPFPRRDFVITISQNRVAGVNQQRNNVGEAPPACPSGNINVGACTVLMAAGEDQSIQSYSVSTTNREGSGSLRCDNATWQPNSGSCVAGNVVQEPWSGWQDDGGIYGCSEWLPRTNTVPSGQQFQQNSNCNLNQSRSADRYTEFNPFPRRDFINTVSQDRVTNVNQLRDNIGTAAPVEVCEYNDDNNFYEYEFEDDNDQSEEFVNRVTINGVRVVNNEWETGDSGRSMPNVNSVVVNGITYTKGARTVRNRITSGSGGNSGESILEELFEVCHFQ